MRSKRSQPWLLSTIFMSKDKRSQPWLLSTIFTSKNKRSHKTCSQLPLINKDKRSHKTCSQLPLINKDKRGTAKWTVAKLIKWVLLVVLLVLIIWGTIGGQLNPLFQKVSSKFDEVLLVLGVNGNAPQAGCRTDINENNIFKGINVDGTLRICRDKCTYILKSPTELLGFNELSIGKGGTSVSNDNKSYSFDTIVNGYNVDVDLTKCKEERDIYNSLVSLAKGFKPSDFKIGFSNIEIVPSSLVITVTQTMKLTQTRDSLEKDNVKYYWDGTVWRKVMNKVTERMQNNQWVSQTNNEGAQILDDKSDNDVIEEINEYYRSGDYIYWNYEGDGKLNSAFGDLNANYQSVKFDKSELKNWLDSKMSLVDSSADNKELDIIIQGAGIVGTDVVYFYNSNDKQIRKKRLIFGSSVVKESDLIDELMKRNGENKIWWEWKGGSKDETRTLIGDKQVAVYKTQLDKNFKEWMKSLMANFTKDSNDYKKFMGEFSTYIDEDAPKIDDKKVEIAPLEVGDSIRVFIYIDESDKYASEEGSDVVRKGIYFSGDGFDFGTYTSHNDRGSFNNKNGWIYLDDSDWSDFKKADNIFKYLYERCGKDEKS